MNGGRKSFGAKKGAVVGPVKTADVALDSPSDREIARQKRMKREG